MGSPTWRPNRSGDSGLVAGRAYIYHSTSAGGWALGQTINSPYSGSQFHTIQYEKNENLSGPSSPGGSGASHFGAKPAMSGNIIAIPAPMFTRHPDINGYSLTGTDPDIKTSTIYGAVVALSGSENKVNKTIEQEVTESVTSIVYVTQSVQGPMPFRVGGAKGSQNLRMQSPSGYYRTFKS